MASSRKSPHNGGHEQPSERDSAELLFPGEFNSVG